MGGFFTRGGKVRPITPRKGGVGVAAVVLAGAVAFGGGGLGGGAASVGGTVDAAVGQSIKARSANAKSAARRGNTDEAWRRLGLKAGRKAVERALECVLHSYGQVQEFFVRSPCRSLERVLLAFGDGQGNTLVVSIAWVRMPSAGSAADLKQLADTDGTGNVSPIASEVLELHGVRFTGRHYSSRRARSLVVIAEAAPGGGMPDPDLLTVVAAVAAELPPP